MATIYRQYNYPNVIYAGEPMPASGCGPTSVAIITNTDPVVVANYMQSSGYAVDGCGTAWEGIPAGLKKFGYDGKQLNYGSLLGNSTSQVFTTFRNSIRNGYMGILLMGVGKNNYWTNGGHYITITNYRNSDDKYYVIDPANSARDGWHSWADFETNIKVCYTTTAKWNGTGGDKYMFSVDTIEYGSENNSVLLFEEIMKARGYYTGALDKSYGNACIAACKKYQKLRGLAQDGICGPQTWKDLLGL